MTDRQTLDGAGRTALVTGASSGIGAAFARLLAGHGFDLVLTARREERLQAIAASLRAGHEIDVHVVAADLAEPAAPEALFSELGSRGLQVDVLVNNAGYGIPGTFDRSPWPRHRDFLEVMAVAPTHLAHLATPAMAARGYGRIINVGSVAALLPPHAGGTLYYPVKAYLLDFSLALHEELRGSGVNVTALCPGFTHTEFQEAAGGTVEAVSLPEIAWMDADTVARLGYRAVEANAAVCVPGWFNRSLVLLFKLLPERAGRWLIRSLA